MISGSMTDASSISRLICYKLIAMLPGTSACTLGDASLSCEFLGDFVFDLVSEISLSWDPLGRIRGAFERFSLAGSKAGDLFDFWEPDLLDFFEPLDPFDFCEPTSSAGGARGGSTTDSGFGSSFLNRFPNLLLKAAANPLFAMGAGVVIGLFSAEVSCSLSGFSSTSGDDSAGKAGVGVGVGVLACDAP